MFGPHIIESHEIRNCLGIIIPEEEWRINRMKESGDCWTGYKPSIVPSDNFYQICDPVRQFTPYLTLSDGFTLEGKRYSLFTIPWKTRAKISELCTFPLVQENLKECRWIGDGKVFEYCTFFWEGAELFKKLQGYDFIPKIHFMDEKLNLIVYDYLPYRSEIPSNEEVMEYAQIIFPHIRNEEDLDEQRRCVDPFFYFYSEDSEESKRIVCPFLELLCEHDYDVWRRQKYVFYWTHSLAKKLPLK